MNSKASSMPNGDDDARDERLDLEGDRRSRVKGSTNGQLEVEYSTSPLLLSSSSTMGVLVGEQRQDILLSHLAAAVRAYGNEYFDRLISVFSMKFLVFLGITQFFVCGVLMGVLGAAYLPVFKELVGLDASTQQVYVIVSMLPYTMKPLVGVVSDLVPIAGYHKKYWLVQAILIGVLGSSYLAASQSKDAVSSTPFLLVACLAAMNYELSVANLLSEGKYSEIMRKHPQSGTDILAFTQACSALGALTAMAFVGPLSDAGNFQTLFYIAAAVCVTPILPTLLNCLPETPRTAHEEGMLAIVKCPVGNLTNGGYGSTNNGDVDDESDDDDIPCLMFDRRQFERQRKLLLVTALVGLGGPILALLTAFGSRRIGIVVIVAILVVIVLLSYRTFPRQLANIVAYGILTNMSQISFRSALQYFYTADEECVPDGPQFSYSFYITYNGIVGEIFMFAAVIFYQTYMSSWRYRTVLTSTLILSCLGRLADIIIVMRWNITMFSIPDKVLFLFASSMFESMTSMLHYLPFTAIISKICPRGVESATFAFVGGVMGFVAIFTSLLGATIMDWSGLKTVAPGCDFGSLPLLIATFYIALPLLVGLPSIRFLIPDALQSDSLIPDNHEGENIENAAGIDSHNMGPNIPIVS